MDQLVVLNPRSAHTGAMYSAKQLFIMPVGRKAIRKAATRMPQPLNCFFSIVFFSFSFFAGVCSAIFMYARPAQKPFFRLSSTS